jgi:Icc-related predicted phosphoesterase
MTTFIALPDLHDQSESLKRIAKPLYDADVVLLVGDMTNGNMNHLMRLFAILEDYNETIFAVAGNLDTEQMNTYLAREGISLHRRHLLYDGVAIAGVGGALPFAGKYVFSEAQFAQFLDDTQTDLPAGVPQVLMCHQPPYGALDRLPSGQHVGSHAVRAFLERVQPAVCFTGHIHEAVGVAHIGATTLINAGPLWVTESYGYAEIVDGKLITAEIRHA